MFSCSLMNRANNDSILSPSTRSILLLSGSTIKYTSRSASPSKLAHLSPTSTVPNPEGTTFSFCTKSAPTPLFRTPWPLLVFLTSTARPSHNSRRTSSLSPPTPLAPSTTNLSFSFITLFLSEIKSTKLLYDCASC
uniref:Uncharacterized protein n=1 Tax=Opuntia streptacantha TaxID=393608 RepID=A0A7C9ELG1_OPUST